MNLITFNVIGEKKKGQFKTRLNLLKNNCVTFPSAFSTRSNSLYYEYKYFVHIVLCTINYSFLFIKVINFYVN